MGTAASFAMLPQDHAFDTGASERPAIEPVVRFEAPDEFLMPAPMAMPVPSTSVAEDIELMVKRVYQAPEPAASPAPMMPPMTLSSDAPTLEAPMMEMMSFEPVDEKKELPVLSFYDDELTKGEPVQLKPEEFTPLPQAAEVSAGVMQAEVWMSEHNPRKAIEVLLPFADDRAPLLPAPTLYLLDLYRLTNDTDQYQALLARASEQFDINLPAEKAAVPPGGEEEFPMLEMDLDIKPEGGRGLESFPDIQKAINDNWQDDHIIAYLENLLLSFRDGFDLSVYREIAWTISLAKERIDQQA
jgi:hypothetical protein